MQSLMISCKAPKVGFMPAYWLQARNNDSGSHEISRVPGDNDS